MKVYEFCYSGCIYESSAATVSIHSTKEGAEKAMQIHKAFAKKEWEEMYKPEDEMDEYDWAKCWIVRECEVINDSEQPPLIDDIIKGFELRINELKDRQSDYYRGVRDGYQSGLNFIKMKQNPPKELPFTV